MEYHVPVLVDEVVRALVLQEDGVYLDCTVGGGGHSRALLEALGPEGRLLGVDRDTEAIDRATACLGDYQGRFVLTQAAFGEIGPLLEREGPVHGALFDLGVSSHQIDVAGRGFSYHRDGPLDMRMDPAKGHSAAVLVAESSEAELADLIWRYGEERGSRRIARAIGLARQSQSIETTGQLRQLIEQTRPRHLPKTLARVFQALRIAVNDELGQLERALTQVLEGLLPGGRLAVIAYHSLEDRLVKQTLAARLGRCSCPPGLPVCRCGRKTEFVRVGAGVIKASAVEIDRNRRARSARMRIYEKVPAEKSGE
jgi:16S rRNA (cytosine1402-N4)-methyltransferase